MLPSKNFVLIFMIYYNSNRLNEGYQQGYKELSRLGTNFLLKGNLKYEEYGISMNWLIEESIFGDEKNSIVTLINEEHERVEIKVFRDFKRKNISLICIQNECGRNTDLLDKSLTGLTSDITQIVKATLLLGPYRMLLCETGVNKVYSEHWDWPQRVTYPCGPLYLKPGFRDYGRIKYIKIRDSKNRLLVDQRNESVNLILYIKQTEPFEKAEVSMLTKSNQYKFNESITKYNESEVDREYETTQLAITSLDSVTAIEIINKRFHLEFVYDRKFGLKYIPSGLNECTIESSSVDNELNYLVSESYRKEFVKELYLPRNLVAAYSMKLRVEAEYNVTIGNGQYDLAVKTYSESYYAVSLVLFRIKKKFL
ncbi:uncharacterized protein LOC112539771 [Tetranychus urticae]|uniref:uncharacterized protein LOC112539771 n=1 Tax=Tetranychus urticae TaxID=32264 RepID=UPI000D65C3DE|nr:uncharacterized protein LOC112539771 [Tetranychus urticae]